jgi:hypothetical protein
MSWLPKISMGLTLDALAQRLRCAECGGPPLSPRRRLRLAPLHVLLGGAVQPFPGQPSISRNKEMVETFIRPIEKAPTNTDLCIFGRDSFGLYQIPFPCRLEAGRWINAHLRDDIKVMPVGWKPWAERDRRVKLGRSNNDPQPTFQSTN